MSSSREDKIDVTKRAEECIEIYYNAARELAQSHYDTLYDKIISEDQIKLNHEKIALNDKIKLSKEKETRSSIADKKKQEEIDNKEQEEIDARDRVLIQELDTLLDKFRLRMWERMDDVIDELSNPKSDSNEIATTYSQISDPMKHFELEYQFFAKMAQESHDKICKDKKVNSTPVNVPLITSIHTDIIVKDSTYSSAIQSEMFSLKDKDEKAINEDKKSNRIMTLGAIFTAISVALTTPATMFLGLLILPIALGLVYYGKKKKEKTCLSYQVPTRFNAENGGVIPRSEQQKKRKANVITSRSNNLINIVLSKQSSGPISTISRSSLDSKHSLSPGISPISPPSKDDSPTYEENKERNIDSPTEKQIRLRQEQILQQKNAIEHLKSNLESAADKQPPRLRNIEESHGGTRKRLSKRFGR